MTGADVLCEVLLANDVNVCFANPGTSELHFVMALDHHPAMRCVLGLFEGVATGAADGYGRMRGRPAATLMHAGAGLANGLANLHNARRGRSPVLNVVGDHAAYHLQYDAPLTSDIESLARPMSAWVGRATGPGHIAALAEEGILGSIANSGVSTLILPADASWGEAPDAPVAPAVIAPKPQVTGDHIRDVAAAIRAHRGSFAFVVAGDAATDPGLDWAGRIAAAHGGRVFSEVIPGRVSIGGNRPGVERIPYFVDEAVAFLKDVSLVVLAGAPEPVAFFAYPGKPSRIMAPAAEVLVLGQRTDDLAAALGALADELDAAPFTRRAAVAADDGTDGPLTDDMVSRILARCIPDDAIIIDEALTSLRGLFPMIRAPVDYLTNAGGSIGGGLPMALGAAVACPDRKVINLEGDGSGMYTLQALWSMAHEDADVLVVLLNNRRYAILQIEIANLGFNEIGANALDMTQLDRPVIDWVKLAQSMGVEAARADTGAAFRDLVKAGLARRGPFLIEAMI